MTPAEQHKLFVAWCVQHPEWKVKILDTVDVTAPIDKLEQSFVSLGDLMQSSPSQFSNLRFWWIKRSPTGRPSLTSRRSAWNSAFDRPHALLVDTLSIATELEDMRAIGEGQLNDVSLGRVSIRAAVSPHAAHETESADQSFIDQYHQRSAANSKAAIYDQLRRFSLGFYVTEDHWFVDRAQNAIAARRRGELFTGQAPEWLLTYVVDQSASGTWLAQSTGHDDVFGSATTIDALAIMLSKDREAVLEEVGTLASRGVVFHTTTDHVLPIDWKFPKHVEEVCGIPSLLTLFRPESLDPFLHRNPTYAKALEAPRLPE